MRAGQTLVDTSTCPVSLARELAAECAAKGVDAHILESDERIDERLANDACHVVLISLRDDMTLSAREWLCQPDQRKRYTCIGLVDRDHDENAGADWDALLPLPFSRADVVAALQKVPARNVAVES